MENSKSLLEARAVSVARQVEIFLQFCVDDVLALSQIDHNLQAYSTFGKNHLRKIWIRAKEDGKIVERRQKIPLYREITWTNFRGIEQVRIDLNRKMSGQRDLSQPYWGTYGIEDYFNQAAKLPQGRVFVSHLLGRHVRKEEQLKGDSSVETAVSGEHFKGVVRFATPVYKNGKFIGVASLALDHRHLMEFTQHVLPFGKGEVVFPSYSSGNYAFLFDNEGWIITHPKFWDIRGHDRGTGKIVDPSSKVYNEHSVKAGFFPFNLLYVPFIHPNYREIAMTALSGKSGVTTTTSVAGIMRTLAFAPIRFSHGVYEKNGFFGGVTLGAQTDLFHKAVDKTPSAIRDALNSNIRDFVIIILLAGILVASIAFLLARSFTTPILMLAEKVKSISQGRFNISVKIHSNDELEMLGQNVEDMGRKLEEQKSSLMQSMTELENSKKEAVRERDFIESIFSHMMSGLVVIDSNDLVTNVNQKAVRMLDLDSENLLNQPVRQVLSAFPPLLEQIRSGKNDNEISGMDLEIKLSDRQKKHLEISVSSIKRAGSKTKTSEQESVLLIFRDVTHRKTMEEHLRRSDRLVSLGTLAAGIAHEIRNPLTGISLLLDDLHDRLFDRERERVLMQKALEEIEKLEKIVTELLEFAAAPTSKNVVKDLGKVIDHTLFLVNKQCLQQNVEIIRDEDRSLPPLRLDPEKLKQAFLNILLNAVKVMPEGGQITIRTKPLTDPDAPLKKTGVKIEICDTGPGIHPDDIDYIFDPFFTRNPDGFGLGLSITHTIIEEHRGSISAENHPIKGGACFTIILPLTEDYDGKDPGRRR